MALYATRTAAGVHAESKNWHGVYGLSESTTGGCGVFGKAMRGVGVLGESFGSYDSVGVKGVTDGGGLAAIQGDGGAPHGEKQRAGARVY